MTDVSVLPNSVTALALIDSLLISFTTKSEFKINHMSLTIENALYPIIDCHAHLCSSEFEYDLDYILQKAINPQTCNLHKIICVAEDYNDCIALLNLQQKYPNIIDFCAGMHPCKADLSQLEKVLQFIDEYHERLIGIGECGLDYSLHVIGRKESKDIENTLNSNQNTDIHELQSNIMKTRDELINIQKIVFDAQILKALKYNLPLNIHSRNAGHYAIEFLSQYKKCNALLHAFDGKPKYALDAYETHGYMFSIPPSIVRSKQKQSLVCKLPLEALLLETDSPALSHIKGERNEPMNILHSIAQISILKNVDLNCVRQITTRNAQKLFKKLKFMI